MEDAFTKEEIFGISDEVACRMFDRCQKLVELSQSITGPKVDYIKDGVRYKTVKDEADAYHEPMTISCYRIHDTEEMIKRYSSPYVGKITIIPNSGNSVGRKFKKSLSKFIKSNAVYAIKDTTDYFIRDFNATMAKEIINEAYKELLDNFIKLILKARTLEDIENSFLLISFADELKRYIADPALVERKQNFISYSREKTIRIFNNTRKGDSV